MPSYPRVKKWLLIGVALWFFLLFGMSRMFMTTDFDGDTTLDYTLQKLMGKNASPEDLKKIRSALEKIEILQNQNEILQKKLFDLRSVYTLIKILPCTR